VFGQGGLDLRGEELGLASGGKDVAEPLEQLLGLEIVEGEAGADSAGDRQELLGAELVGQSAVTAEDDSGDGAGVAIGTGEDAQLGQDAGVHLLGLVDKQHGSAAGGLDVVEPGVSEDLEAAPAVVWSQGDAEEVSHLAVEVGQPALRSCQDAEDDVGRASSPCEIPCRRRAARIRSDRETGAGFGSYPRQRITAGRKRTSGSYFPCSQFS
jgi:hypothetical protein